MEKLLRSPIHTTSNLPLSSSYLLLCFSRCLSVSLPLSLVDGLSDPTACSLGHLEVRPARSGFLLSHRLRLFYGEQRRPPPLLLSPWWLDLVMAAPGTATGKQENATHPSECEGQWWEAHDAAATPSRVGTEGQLEEHGHSHGDSKDNGDGHYELNSDLAAMSSGWLNPSPMSSLEGSV